MRADLRAYVAALLISLPALSAAHDYYAPNFQIIHPWTQTAMPGAATVGLYMRIVDIAEDDRLLSARTDVAERVELRLSMAYATVSPDAPASAASAPAVRPGIVLARGRDLSLSPFTAYLVLHGLRTQLHQGRQYPLMLVFERAGEVPVDFVVGSH